MKLTYTIEFDVERATGPNVKKNRVSGAIINDLIRILADWEFDVKAPKRGEDTEFFVKDFTVWPHEGSEPNRESVMPRSTVDRVPTTQPVDTPAGS